MSETEKDHVDSEYDLKKSKKRIGALLPVITGPDGQVIEGHHRKKADPDWPEMVNPDLDTPAKVALAKIVANLQRRDVPSLEKVEWVEEWANAKIDEGFEGDLVKLLAEETGFSKRWAQKYLPDKFKQKEMDKKSETVIEPDRDQLIKIDLAKGMTYRQVQDKHGCGASTVRRLVQELETEQAAAKKERIPVLQAETVQESITAEIPEKAVIRHKQEELREVKKADPLEGVNKFEIDAMLELSEDLEKFQAKIDHLKEEGVFITPYGQNVIEWTNRFLNWKPFDLYKAKHNQ